jgi:hypothetical protein
MPFKTLDECRHYIQAQHAEGDDATCRASIPISAEEYENEDATLAKYRDEALFHVISALPPGQAPRDLDEDFYVYLDTDGAGDPIVVIAFDYY